jgi:hypothetical protein
MHTYDQALQTRAAAARHAIRHLHVDPLLALSYVVWPTPRIERKAA